MEASEKLQLSSAASYALRCEASHVCFYQSLASTLRFRGYNGLFVFWRPRFDSRPGEIIMNSLEQISCLTFSYIYGLLNKVVGVIISE
jgi:hypothetical protein